MPDECEIVDVALGVEATQAVLVDRTLREGERRQGRRREKVREKVRERR